MAINHVTLIGNLGNAPELKTTSNGKQVAKFSIAVNEKRGGADKTDWFNITAWEKTAEACAKYLVKGSKVCVQGRLQTGSYEKDGIKRYTTDIIATQVEFLSSKGKDGGNEAREPGSDDGEVAF